MPLISTKERRLLKPYFELSEKLGCFIGQLIHSGLRRINLSYYGEVALLNYQPLTSIILKGILTSLLEGVNMVSASVVAKERGIEITESKHEAHRTLPYTDPNYHHNRQQYPILCRLSA